MNKRNRRPALLALLLSLSLPLNIVVGQTTTTPAQTGRGINLKYMDTSAKPCEDFYQYAAGKWIADNPIPADRSSWGAGSELSERNFEVLHQILEDAAKDKNAPKGSAKRKVGDFYRSGMDEARIEAEGARPLADEFARIEAIRDIPTLQDELSHLHKHNLAPAFAFFAYQDYKNSTRIISWLYQGGLGLPNRDYYTNEDEKSKEIRTQYVAHVAKMLELLGDKPEQAASEAKTVMEMETRLAKSSMTPVEERDPAATYHKMTLAELNALTPGFSWNRYFKGIGLADPGDINVAQPEFYKEVGRMMTSIPMSDWKTYLRWQLINAQAGRLSSAFVNQDFNFYGKTLRGTKQLRPRWKRILEATDVSLGEALGQLYVERAFSPKAKAKAQELVMNLKAALRDRIKVLDWISEPTRQQALKKLDAIAVKVGYPDKWRDYSALNIDGGSYVTNAMRADAFEFQRNLNKIGKPIDRTEWGMTPPTVNAYYNPNFNEIAFPAGILQPPFFDPEADDATNYGGVGGAIGHELTHGFDDQGRQFDAEGNLKDWWTAEDEKNYMARAAIVEKQYGEYVALEDVHINGKLTMGENIADIGGLKIAYLALQKALEGKPRPPLIDGFTPEQRFFLSFAQNWRSNTRPEAMRVRLASDPHSPPRFRVLGPLSNMPEFFQAFGCKPGDAGMRAENIQVKIW
ncbi:MAG TPA: M13 family metallopeptidase [Pyrinomonadaceae bacterium]|nr:M13 family metallopeptidase [Pyrinomonadaceae bacterium]